MQLSKRVLSIVLALLMLLPLVAQISGIATASSSEDIQMRCEELLAKLDTGDVSDYDSVLKEYNDIKNEFTNGDEIVKQNEYIKVDINKIEDKISLYRCNEVVNGTNRILNDYNSGLYENNDKLNKDIQRIFEISENIIIKHYDEFAIEGYLDKLRALTQGEIKETGTDDNTFDGEKVHKVYNMYLSIKALQQVLLHDSTFISNKDNTAKLNRWLWLNMYNKTDDAYSKLNDLELQNTDMREVGEYLYNQMHSDTGFAKNLMLSDFIMLTSLYIGQAESKDTLPSEPSLNYNNSYAIVSHNNELDTIGLNISLPSSYIYKASDFADLYRYMPEIDVVNLFLKDSNRAFGVYGSSVSSSFRTVTKSYIYSSIQPYDEHIEVMIKRDIFNDPDFVRSPNDFGVWGLYDATGNKNKGYIQNIDWDAALYAVINGRHGKYYPTPFAINDNVPLRNLSYSDLTSNYELVPYVIKHQTVEMNPNGVLKSQGGWHIDCYIRRKNIDPLNPSLVTVSYKLNLPTGIKITDPRIGLPSGDIGNPGFDYTTKPLYMNNQSTSEEPLRWIDAVYTYKDIHGETKNEQVKLAFAGYIKESSGQEDDNGAYIHSGQLLKINYDTVLVAQWRQIPNFNIAYLGLEGSNFEESNPNPTEYGLATPTFSLKSPEKPGYIFVGWTGGVIDEDMQGFPDIRITSPTINVKVNDTGKGGDRVYEAHFIEDRGQKTESEKTIHQGTIQNNWITENNKSSIYVYTQTPSTPDRATISKNDITKENDESMKYNYVISSRLLTKLNPGDKYAVYDKVEDGTDSRYSGRVDSIIPDNSSMLGDIRIYVKTETLGTTENTETDSSSSKDESAEDIETGNGEDYSEEIAGSEQAPDKDTSGEIEDNTGEDIEEDSDTGNEANPEETTDNITYDFDRLTNDTDNNLLNVFGSSNSEWKVYNENKLSQVLESKRITEVLIVYDIASELAEDTYIRTGINMTHRGNTQLTGDSQTIINNSTIVVSKDTHHVEITNTTRLETYKDATVAILPKAGGTGVEIIIGAGLGLVVISLATLFIIKKKPKKLF